MDEAERQAPNPCPEAGRGMRTFTLNSPEGYAALCPRRDEPWIPNGALPREPRAWDRPVLREREAAVGRNAGDRMIRTK